MLLVEPQIPFGDDKKSGSAVEGRAARPTLAPRGWGTRVVLLGEGLGFDAEDGGQIVDDGLPGVAAIRRAVDLAAGGAEVDAAVVQRIDGHGVAEHVDVAVLLGQAGSEGFPFVAAGFAAKDLQGAVDGKVVRVGFDGDDVEGFGLVSDGSRCQTRLNSHGCAVPSYDWCVPGMPS